MHVTSIFPCIMRMISNYMIFFKYLFSIFSLQISQILASSYDSCCFVINNAIFFFLKLIIFSACSFWFKNFFIQSLPLQIPCLVSMLLKEDIIDIEKPDGICSLTFVMGKFSGLFLHPSIFLLKNCYYKWCFIRFLILIKF